jgi:hypothetical protein
VASAAPHQSPALQPGEKVPLPGQASIAGAVSLQASFPRHILQSPGEGPGPNCAVCDARIAGRAEIEGASAEGMRWQHEVALDRANVPLSLGEGALMP